MIHPAENKLQGSRRDRLIDELLKSPLAQKLASSMEGDGPDAVRGRARHAAKEFSLERVKQLEAAAKTAVADREAAKRAYEAAESATRLAVDAAQDAHRDIIERKSDASRIAEAGAEWLRRQNLLTVADVERRLRLAPRA